MVFQTLNFINFEAIYLKLGVEKDIAVKQDTIVLEFTYVGGVHLISHTFIVFCQIEMIQ